jgi:hypothetical protein
LTDLTQICTENLLFGEGYFDESYFVPTYFTTNGIEEILIKESSHSSVEILNLIEVRASRILHALFDSSLLGDTFTWAPIQFHRTYLESAGISAALLRVGGQQWRQFNEELIIGVSPSTKNVFKRVLSERFLPSVEMYYIPSMSRYIIVLMDDEEPGLALLAQ